LARPSSPEVVVAPLAEDLAYGTYIHLGLGNPALAGRYVPDGIEAVAFHGGGFIAIGSRLSAGAEPDLINVQRPAVILVHLRPAACDDP
jgi:acyl CoA:acetate/3-ketoacid CoA transferase beta subunit